MRNWVSPAEQARRLRYGLFPSEQTGAWLYVIFSSLLRSILQVMLYNLVLSSIRSFDFR